MKIPGTCLKCIACMICGESSVLRGQKYYLDFHYALEPKITAHNKRSLKRAKPRIKQVRYRWRKCRLPLCYGAGGSKRHIHQQGQVETIPPNCRICGCRIGCRFESGTRLCLNRKSA